MRIAVIVLLHTEQRSRLAKKFDDLWVCFKNAKSREMLDLGDKPARRIDRGVNLEPVFFADGKVIRTVARSCVDTTGAGDVFHGAFCYSVLQGMSLADALDFSNAMAALNCTAMGARGGICGLDEVRALMHRAPRRPHPDMQARLERSASTT